MCRAARIRSGIGGGVLELRNLLGLAAGAALNACLALGNYYVLRTVVKLNSKLGWERSRDKFITAIMLLDTVSSTITSQL